MRYAKQNTAIFCVLTAALSAFSVLTYSRLLSEKPDGSAVSALESAMGTEAQMNYGNDYGMVWSLDGEEIAGIHSCRHPETGRITELFCAADGYNSVIGSPSGGLIRSCRSILLSNTAEINRQMRCGNSIVTTLHSGAMRTAMRELAAFREDTDAGICVVLREGTVLVSAGNNGYDSSAFFQPENYADLYVDYNASPLRKGSVWKPVSDRMFLVNDELMPDGFSLYINDFPDVSQHTAGSAVIHNWDWNISGCYEYTQDGVMYRRFSLSDSLIASSNTYVLRHAEALGLKESYRLMTELYALDKELVTEINTHGVEAVKSDRLPYFFWGQDAVLSNVRLCQLYNFICTGEFYAPFYCAQVLQPDGTIIYNASPEPKQDYKLDVDKEDDILIHAMADTFESYLTDALKNEFSADLLSSRRFLAKSGTAENADSENRVMMLTVLNEDKSDVICSACISVNHTTTGISNETLIRKLLLTLQAADIL